MHKIFYPVPVVTTRLKMPTAAWAWEFLRRNPEYIRDYYSSRHGRSTIITLNTGGQLIRSRQRNLSAEKWGLVRFSDPALRAVDANVFWLPRMFPAALLVSLKPYRLCSGKDVDDNIIDLNALKTRRISLELIDGTRHILICSTRFWIQLYCKDCRLVGERADMQFHIGGKLGVQRRFDTATQLLSLYRSSGHKLGLIGRKKNSDRLADSLIALDVHTKGGTYRDIAIALKGKSNVLDCWQSSGCSLKDHAITTLSRGREYVSGKYLELLTKKTL